MKLFFGQIKPEIKINEEEFTPRQVTLYRVKEIWFFDNGKSVVKMDSIERT